MKILKPDSGPVSRRSFLKTTAKASALIGFPTVIPSTVLGLNGAVAPSERITVGHIGCGKMSISLRNSFSSHPDVQMVACSDVESVRLAEFKSFYSDILAKRLGRESANGVEAYDNYLDLLARKDIDAVLIATPDHWHGNMSIQACQAGKDVYCEKPLTFTVGDAYGIVDAVQRHGRVLQTGSMQRSSREFRFAVELIRNGRIGKVHTVNVPVAQSPSFIYNLVEEQQTTFNWDRWVGPSTIQPYNTYIAPKSLDEHWAGWRRFSDFGGGVQCDWGAHMYDITQWALRRDGDAPVDVIPAVTGDPERKHLTYIYDDGVKIYGRQFTEFEPKMGVEFIGDQGSLFVGRGQLETKPEFIKLEPIRANEESVYRSTNHVRNFLDCIKTRQKPICDETVGASTAIVCHLGNIANRIGEAFKWDHKTGLTDNPKANRYLNPPKRDGYAI